MADEKELSILRQGADAWNEYRRGWIIFPNLAEADLSDMDLEGANLSFARLSHACLTGTVLRGADLRAANLTSATLVDAKLEGADLSGALLHSADLSGADLTCANLSDVCMILFERMFDINPRSVCRKSGGGSYLTHANLTGATISSTLFGGCDLSSVEGLDTLRHLGPSSITIETIFRSRGQLPERFLRGCGVPDSLIRYIPSLVSSEDGIQFYSCFISYSSKDEQFAMRLYGRMRDAHLRVWFAPVDIEGGKKLHEQIEAAIRIYDKLLIVLSEASLQSAWVMDELRKGFKAERDTGERKLFPVRLTDYETLKRWDCRDSVSGKDLAEEVRQYHIPDFSHWKDHDEFEAAFSRLLKDLRAEDDAETH